MDLGALLLSALLLGAIGLFFGSLIAVAEKRLRVWEDPRIDGAAGLLPGTNCGACGFPGCRAFAEALVGGKVLPAGCTNMGKEQILAVAGYLGVEAGEARKRVARLLCAGGTHVAIQQARYEGLATCAAAKAVASGGKGCSWGCLGLSDCERSCTFGAIRMNRYGLPVVEPEKCTACNDCVEACPQDLFTLMPVDWKLIVQCKSALEGDPAEALCKFACTACGKCALDAAPGVITIRGGLAVVDYSRNERAGPEATSRCPTGAIAWVEGRQVLDRAPAAGSLVA
ncbi:MAG TPA: (Fe-S)-binding protein [Planctomycetota bacterium]|nr:(Fe-S)-binding protein [Planctomycetota bacterium]